MNKKPWPTSRPDEPSPCPFFGHFAFVLNSIPHSEDILQPITGLGVWIGMKPIAMLALIALFTLVVFVRQSMNQRPLIRTPVLAQPQAIARNAESDAFRLKLHRIVARAERSIREEKNTSLLANSDRPTLKLPAAKRAPELQSHSVD
jgi:hypothetical protein